MHVLTEHHEAVIDWLAKSRRYQNARELLREGLSLIVLRESLDAAKLDALREAARVGFSDLDEGQFFVLPSDALEEFVGNLGQEAEARGRKAGR